jgi:hypothetical protein
MMADMEDNPYRAPAEFDAPKPPERKLTGSWPMVVFLGFLSVAFAFSSGVLLAGAVSGGVTFFAGQVSWVRSAVIDGELGVFMVLLSAMFFYSAKRLAKTLRQRLTAQQHIRHSKAE